MSRKIEALLLIASIGGGFLGLTIVLAQLSQVVSFSLGHLLVFGAAIIAFSYIIYAGLEFSSNPDNVRPLKIAFLIQIPWFSSPILAYKMAAGFSLSGILHANGFNFLYNIGSDFSISILDDQSWGLGVNLAAIVLYFLATKGVKAVPNKSLKRD